jgi:hypothetical protein
MTTYEMLDLAQSNFSTSAAYLSIYIALLSGYLVAAYMVGSRLSKAQFLLANSVYLVIQVLSIFTIYNFNKSANSWVSRGRPDTNISGEGALVPYISEIVAIVLFFTMLLSAWFMWKSRNVEAD